MNFKRLRKFFTSEPRRLADQLEEFEGNVDAALRVLELTKPPTFLGISTAELSLVGWQHAAVDTSGEDVTVILPEARKAPGGLVLLNKTSNLNTMKVISLRGTVEGASSVSKRAASLYIYVSDGNAWNCHSRHLPSPTADGQILLSSDGLWELLDAGTGANDTLTSVDGVVAWSRRTISRHDTTHSPIGLWQFPGSGGGVGLNDSSGNGFHLTVETGTERYTDFVPGTQGVYLDGSTALWHNVSAASLRLLGDMTFEALFLLEEVTAGAYWFSHTAAGETEDTNQLYGLQYSAASAPSIGWIQESGAGVNAAASFANNYMFRGQPTHMAVTRASGVVTVYLNGRAWGTASGVLTAPTGGSTGRFRIGGDQATRIKGVMCSAKLIGSALTADQVKAEYNRTLGPMFGRIP